MELPPGKGDMEIPQGTREMQAKQMKALRGLHVEKSNPNRKAGIELLDLAKIATWDLAKLCDTCDAGHGYIVCAGVIARFVKQ